jgi:UDP-N-acetylmuramoyl-L-alanyl-D-glutamate--2,6-diaminopimelate ligase
MKLSHIVAELPQSLVTGPVECELSGLTYDSRQVSTNSIFVAVRGLWVDGHDYVDAAVKNGATAIIAETTRPESLSAGVTWVEVQDSEVALGLAADAFYDHPSRAMTVLAATGTNGKTTITWLLHHILMSTGHESGLVGTVEQRFGNIRRSTIFTTPPSSDLHALLGEMRDYGCSHAAIEASSHGMAMNRLAGVHVAVAAFSNLSRDHLDFHETMDAYRAAKWRLFDEFASQAVFNIDDPVGAEFMEEYSRPALTLSVAGQPADLRVSSLAPSLSGCDVAVELDGRRFEIALPLVGEFNVQNALLAAGMAILAGVPADEAFQALESATAAPGRLEVVPGPRHVLVDYAHTPDALANVLKALRVLGPKRLICVFGAGGDRDPGKRPQMGRVAEELADVVVVTSDNPRTEDPKAILADIQAGLSGSRETHIEVDRGKAIELAIRAAGEDDVVLIAGKGHEDYQIIGEERRHFDDRLEARRVLESL